MSKWPLISCYLLVKMNCLHKTLYELIQFCVSSTLIQYFWLLFIIHRVFSEQKDNPSSVFSLVILLAKNFHFEITQILTAYLHFPELIAYLFFDLLIYIL